jgi:hypothetical protein
VRIGKYQTPKGFGVQYQNSIAGGHFTVPPATDYQTMKNQV